MARAPDQRGTSITGATLEKARRELGETEEKRAESLTRLGALVDEYETSSSRERDGVPSARRDAGFLLACLRARKFDVERSFQLYLSYHLHRRRHAHVLRDFTPRSVERLLRRGVFDVLDQRLSDGSKVLCIYPSRY